MLTLAGPGLDGFEFFGVPFDPRPSGVTPPGEPREHPAAGALVAQARAVVAAAHASALDTQVRLQRRYVRGLEGGA